MNQDKFNEGDYIIRTWSSGKKTLGKAVKTSYNDHLMFESLETYDKEGSVRIGDIYGPASCIFQGIYHRFALPHEIPNYTVQVEIY